MLPSKNYSDIKAIERNLLVSINRCLCVFNKDWLGSVICSIYKTIISNL